jgi:carbonic anhydrase
LALNTVLYFISLTAELPSQPMSFAVVVVGHTECGGAAACFAAASSADYVPGEAFAIDSGLPADAPLNKWLAPLTELASSLQLSTAPREEALPILVEENVKAQVENVCKSEIIQNAWQKKSRKGKDVFVHGWVYDIGEGKLKDLGVSCGPKA